MTLFDGVIGPGWSCPSAMRRWPGGCWLAPLRARMLAVAGNVHSPVSPTGLGAPLGAWLARQRPGIREIRIRYGGERFWNSGSRRFVRRASPHGPVRLYQDAGEPVLDLSVATEAVVPQRP